MRITAHPFDHSRLYALVQWFNVHSQQQKRYLHLNILTLFPKQGGSKSQKFLGIELLLKINHSPIFVENNKAGGEEIKSISQWFVVSIFCFSYQVPVFAYHQIMGSIFLFLIFFFVLLADVSYYIVI